MNPNKKYHPFPTIELPNRAWPNQKIKHAPIWCSVDLRDGNQALAVPMNVAQKIEMFKMLVSCGFKEIEVGFPAASPTEFEFTRRLIEENLIPEDVIIQVLVQAREDLIAQTIKALVGAKKVIIHLYNSTSPAQRRIVFGLEKSEIIEMAVQGTRWIKQYSVELTRDKKTEVRFQYSPESFSATEVDFALEVCEAVIDEWEPTSENKIILNLPSTVETSTPNVYADQIEWFCKNILQRDCVIISLHTHNDRGTGVAATELGLLAGADRVEGTLFGNGERTGNLDIIIVALNLYTQGVDPKLDFSNLDSLKKTYEHCTGMSVHARHPYSGELVFTAFSGSHQDAIRKGLKEREVQQHAQKGVQESQEENFEKNNSIKWDVPYLSIDPEDIGRKYEEVIRINGQSGKGGVAYILEQECKINLPKDMVREFGVVAGKEIDALGCEVKADDLKKMLWKEYIDRTTPYSLESFHFINDCTMVDGVDKNCTCTAVLKSAADESLINLSGVGNGPIDAFINALRAKEITSIKVLDQSEHALSEGAEAYAIAYVQLQFEDGSVKWGAGIDTNTTFSSIKAVISALNRR